MPGYVLQIVLFDSGYLARNGLTGVIIETLIYSVINLVVNPFMWLAVIAVRSVFDLLIATFDWMIETKKAAKLYVEMTRERENGR